MTITPLIWSNSDQNAVRQQLERILGSVQFLQSPRRQRFLKYLVNEALAGRTERLKGYNIALEVFGRPVSFDPVIDPVVRIEAGRLRGKLREYYETDGRTDPIHIDLPKGGYAPLIEFRAAENPVPLSVGAGVASPERRIDPSPYGPLRFGQWMKWRIVVPVLAIVGVLGAIVGWY